MSEWRTIDSAPSAPVRHEILGTDGYETYVMFWDDWAQEWSIMGEITVDPTHWMPLPAPPTD